MWGRGGLQPIRNNCIFFFEDEELGWTDDGTDDGTDGWKGGPTPTPDRRTPRILLWWRYTHIVLLLIMRGNVL
jgi:hypothetical protein